MIKKHKPLWNNLGNNTRYFIVTGGRGGAKSFEVTRFCNLLTFEKNQKILLTRQTMTSAHLSVIPEFKQKIELLNLESFFDIQKTEIENRQTGSQIIFRGLKTSSGDQTANLKSLQAITTWVVDEAEELTDENVFDKIDFSLRTKGTQSRVILILNPATKEHWIYRRFFEQAGVQEGFTGVNDNVTYIHTTYLDNIENLDSNFLQIIEKLKLDNPKKYSHQILGGWLEKAEGVVFTNWRFGDFDDDLPYVFGADFGFSLDPSTLIKVAVCKKTKRIFAKECLYQAGLVTSELAAVYKMETKPKELIIADGSEPRLIEEFKQRGFNVLKANRDPGSISAGIALLLDYEIIVDGVNIGKELNNYAYSNKKSSLFIDNWNHAIDAMRYATYYLLSDPNRGRFDIR